MKFFSNLQCCHGGYDLAGSLHNYDDDKYGPLLGVSDEGSAVAVIAAAAQSSAKAGALQKPDPMAIGLIVDGERMTSAGEVPIGPDEYRSITKVSFGKTLCTTNVGVRLNARLYQPLPEFRISDAEGREGEWVEAICATFAPFINTPNGEVRRLTVRLSKKAAEEVDDKLPSLLNKLESARDKGKIGPKDLHRISLLIDFEDEIRQTRQISEIERFLDLAAELGVPEVAIDGDLTAAARPRLSVQALLNVLGPQDARHILRYAKARGLKATYRYSLDPESAARTVWTGLHTARAQGLNGAKYGMVPLTLQEQKYVVSEVQRWTADWTAIPAFYVDTPLYSDEDIYLSSQCEEALKIWLSMVSEVGVKVALVDAPDRITPRIDASERATPRRLVKEAPEDRGVLTFEQIGNLISYSNRLGVKVLWSGGIRPHHAFKLGQLGAFGIFTTSSTSRAIAVGPVLAGDWQLAVEKEPTLLGVRRVHGLLQAGFLYSRIGADTSTKPEIGEIASQLSDAALSDGELEQALGTLDAVLKKTWLLYWENEGVKNVD